MGKLVNGEWRYENWNTDEEGHFQRDDTVFRDWITTDDSTPYDVESGRYHLYVSYACPWAHRTLIARQLLGLTDDISVSVVDPFMGKEGWEFSDGPGCIPDPLYGANYLREIYLNADSEFTGRVTVPVLWDKKKETVVNNESREILRMFATVFEPLWTEKMRLSPAQMRDDIDAVIDEIYDPINNGVYRAGFAETQKAYDEAVTELFDALEHWDDLLETQRYLCGDRLTEADICMFTTLIRFDAVYHTHFKCNIRRISDYPNLGPYLRDVYQAGDIAETVNIDHIKQHYYRSHESVNPKRIVPKGPELNFDEPHDRDRLH